MLKLSVRHKILLCIYMVLFPVLIVTSSLMVYRDYRAAMDVSLPQYQAAVNMVEDSINYMERDLEEISVYFSVNDEIYSLLAGPPASVGNNSLFWNDLATMGVIRDILSIKSHIYTLILYPENGLTPFYVSRDASVHNSDINAIRQLPIYQSAIDARGDNVRGQVLAGETGLFIYNTSDKMIFCRELFDLSKKNRLGFLVASLDMSGYQQICENALLYENESIMMMGADGQPVTQVGRLEDAVAADMRQNPPVADGQVPLRWGNYYVFTRVMGSSGDTIYYLSPKGNWDARLVDGLALPVALAVALLVCMWPVSALASRVISRPLDKLYVSMHKFKAGDFEQQVQVKGNDEIAELADTFNHMVQDIRTLIDKNYVMRLRERESELTALQAQINPHFLYNALDSLYWQAVNDGQAELAEDVMSLSELFRLLLSSGESEIPVERELHIITHYLHVQKMRFAKKLDYSIEVDEALMQRRIPKLILQPFVENAIVHGLERKDTWGFVRVTGRVDGGVMCFTIEDNGAGMERQTIDEILFADEDKRYANQRIGRYAIRNVKERMGLRYPQGYTLEIDSEVGVGLTVRIKLPLEE